MLRVRPERKAVVGAVLAGVVLAVVAGLTLTLFGHSKKSANRATSAPSPAASPEGPSAGAASAAPPETPGSGTGSASPSISTCGNGGDVIVRVASPNLPPAALKIAAVRGTDCRNTLADLRSSAPQLSGYCTTAAYAADNPGYDATQVPAPPLNKVQVQVGPGC